MLGSSWVAAQLADSRERLSSIQLVIGNDSLALFPQVKYIEAPGIETGTSGSLARNSDH
jgi:hypothetical protein